MSKWLMGFLIAGFLVASFTIMSATALLKQPLSPGEDILSLLEEIDRATDRDPPDWALAEQSRADLKNGWGRVVGRIQFVAEKDDIVRFGRTVDEMKASISTQDLPTTKRNVETLRSVWHSMR